MGPVTFDPGVIWKKRVGAFGDGQRFREVFCEQGKPYHSGECPRRLLAGPGRINQSFGRSAQDHVGLSCLGSGMTTMIVIVFCMAMLLALAYFIK